MDGRDQWRRLGRRACLGTLLVLAGCLYEPWPAGLPDNRAADFVQEGTATVRDGEETQIGFKTAFLSPPRVEITGFVQSWFKSEPFGKNSFEIVEPSPVGFKIRSNHQEQGIGSFAEIKWRATGTRGRKKTPGEMSPQERLVAQVEKLGGSVKYDE